MIWQRGAAFCVLITIVAIVPADSVASVQAQSGGQTAAPKSAEAGHGFMDYALGKINPQQTDYGMEAATARAMIVSETLGNLLFWSNVVALLLFTGVTTLYIFNLRSGEKRDLIAACLITELWNGRLSDQEEITKRTEQYNLLVEKHNAALATSSTQSAEGASSESRTELRTQRKVERLIDGPRTITKLENHGPGTSGAGKVVPAKNGTDLSDLQQQNLLLERRIEAMQNTEQNLKERLNQTTALLDQERLRNRALKGA